MTKIFYLTCFFIFIVFFNCRKESAPLQPDETRPDPILTLHRTYDPGVTTAFFSLKTEHLSFPDSVCLCRNGNPVKTITLEQDSLTFYDEGLLPATTYEYCAVYVREGEEPDSSNRVTVTTMDTTSHNFTWEVMHFGSGGGSSLNDVAIIDENNIWAVGEIYTDELEPYNVVHWDGVEWELKRFKDDTNWTIVPIRGILYENENSIWFAAGSVFHWNGTTTDLSYLRNTNTSELVETLWASAENNIYGVGNEGLIVHYDGSSWSRRYTPTDLPIQDIWGATDPLTGEEVVLCIASEKYHNYGCKLFKITSRAWELPTEGLSWSMAGIWFIPGRIYYAVGAGVFPVQTLGLEWQYDPEVYMYYSHAVRGIAINNIVVCGGAGFVAHFNGFSWRTYIGNELPQIYGNYYAVDIIENVIVAVGSEGNNDILAIGRRN